MVIRRIVARVYTLATWRVVQSSFRMKLHSLSEKGGQELARQEAVALGSAGQLKPEFFQQPANERMRKIGYPARPDQLSGKIIC
jgi:hypothetical protein